MSRHGWKFAFLLAALYPSAALALPGATTGAPAATHRGVAPTAKPELPAEPARPAAAQTNGTSAAAAATNGAKTPPSNVDVKLTQAVSPDKPIHAGQAVVLSLTVDHPPGARVQIPDSFEPDRWYLIDSHAKTSEHEGAATTLRVLRFGIYRPGETTLKPFPVTVVDKGGKQTVLHTDPVTVKVLSAFANAKKEPTFKAARPPLPIWVDDYTLAWVGGGVALMSLMGLLLVVVARRAANQPAPPPPPRAPHEVALEKLGALAGDDLVERGEYMLFWVRLSEAIREYLGRTYQFPPTELTTAEMLDAMRGVRWPSGIDLQDVAVFLRLCDRVKFGGRVPTVGESSEALRRGFSIVELTRPRIVLEDEKGPDAKAAAGEEEE